MARTPYGTIAGGREVVVVVVGDVVVVAGGSSLMVVAEDVVGAGKVVVVVGIETGSGEAAVDDWPCDAHPVATRSSTMDTVGSRNALMNPSS